MIQYVHLYKTVIFSEEYNHNVIIILSPWAELIYS